jgi:hypothetical protein
MTIDMDLITGVSLGIEFVEAIPELDVGKSIILDLFIVRFFIEFV